MGESDQAGVMSHRMASTLAKRNLIASPPSFKMNEWPNYLGDKPEDAIGKVVRIEQHDVSSDFIIDAIDGEGRLLLKPYNEVAA